MYIESHFFFKLSTYIYFKRVKDNPSSSPGTEHTDPLMPRGGYPANTMVSQGLSWDWWGRSQVLRLGVDRKQATFQSIHPTKQEVRKYPTKSYYIQEDGGFFVFFK